MKESPLRRHVCCVDLDFVIPEEKEAVSEHQSPSAAWLILLLIDGCSSLIFAESEQVFLYRPLRFDRYLSEVTDGDSCRLAQTTASDLGRIFTSQKLVTREHRFFSCKYVQNFNQGRLGSNLFTFESNILSKIIRALECPMK